MNNIITKCKRIRLNFLSNINTFLVVDIYFFFSFKYIFMHHALKNALIKPQKETNIISVTLRMFYLG